VNSADFLLRKKRLIHGVRQTLRAEEVDNWPICAYSMRMEDAMTTLVYDTSAPRRPTNLTVNTDLLRRAKERKINVSSVLESALAEELRLREEAEWKSEAKEAIETYNKKIKEFGLFSDEMRTF